MVRCGPGGEAAAPAKMARDPHALRRPAPGLTAFASAALGHGDRLGILRVQRVLVKHVVWYNNNKCVSTGTGTCIAVVQVHVLQCTLQYLCTRAVFDHAVYF